LHYVLLPKPEACEGDDPAAQILANVIAEFGRLVTEAAQGLADGRVTDRELAQLQAEGTKAQAAIHALLAMAARMNADMRPPAFRQVA